MCSSGCRCGHPDAPIDRFTLQARSVAVVGSGNVALDVTRILAESVDELRHTEMPDHVLKVLERSRVQDIHLIGRRGPLEAKFTTRELQEIGELSNADVLLDPHELSPRFSKMRHLSRRRRSATLMRYCTCSPNEGSSW
jgi:ferredoxin--NADP+ reductase